MHTNNRFRTETNWQMGSSDTTTGINLAEWLVRHRTELLPRWGENVALAVADSDNPQLFSPTTNGDGIPNDSHEAPFVQLETFYDSLVQAAQGNDNPLVELLQMICQRMGQQATGLHDIFILTQRFRKICWKLLRRDANELIPTFELAEQLENLLEYTNTELARSWSRWNEAAIQQRIEEAEFVAQRMNEALEQVDHNTVQLALLNEVSQRLSSSLENADSIEIIAYVGSKLREIFNVAHVSIWLPDTRSQQEYGEVILCAVQVWGLGEEGIIDIQFDPAIEGDRDPGDVLFQSYTRAKMIRAYNPPPDPIHQGTWYQAKCGVLALPLLVNDRATGVVALQDPHIENHFTSAQQDTIQAVVNQAAIALDNARLYAEVRLFNSDLERLVEQRTQELESERDRLSTLHSIATEVSNTLDLDSLLQASLKSLTDITHADHGSIMLVDPETERLVYRAVLGYAAIDSFAGIPIGHGIAGWVAKQKQPELIRDVSRDWRNEPSTVLDEVENQRSGSMVAVPLLAHNEGLGVLMLSHDMPDYFNEDHLRLLTASAGAIAVGIHNANLYNAIVADMEHRSDLLRRQQMETSQIEAILQSLSDGVLVCDFDGGVLSANPACARILERSVESLVLSNLHDILPEYLHSRVDELPLRDLLHRPIGTHNQPRKFDTTVEIGMRIVKMVLSPVLKEDGELIGALLVLRDTTGEVESDRLKTEFIGTMSHELRTPMTSVKGFTQLLAMGSLGPVNDTQREFLNTIQSNAERMISIINDVLEITKIETGSIHLEIRPLHLAEALSGVVSELQEISAAREQDLSIAIPPGLPLIYADPTRLHQILQNLISNALKYTPKGGRIQVQAYEANLEELPETIRDSVISHRRYTRIDVEDTGVGIAPRDVERVFDRFYRTENPLKVEAGGTGLGLSLTRPLVEMMGGRIWVQSTLGEGSTFSIVLPAVDQP